MQPFIKKTLPTCLLTLIGLMSSTSAMAIQCPTTLNSLNLDVMTKTIHVTGVGFDATYSGENPSIIALLSLQASQSNIVVTYTLDSATCLGGNIQAALY